MKVTFEDRGRIVAVLQDGKQVGSIAAQADNTYAFMMFGDRPSGKRDSLETAKEAAAQACG